MEIQIQPNNSVILQDTIGLQPMEFEVQPNSHQQASKIKSGFKPMEFQV
jgi:hypothetical protein